MNGDKAAIKIKRMVEAENKKIENDANKLVCNIVACTANTTQYWTELAI